MGFISAFWYFENSFTSLFRTKQEQETPKEDLKNMYIW